MPKWDERKNWDRCEVALKMCKNKMFSEYQEAYMNTRDEQWKNPCNQGILIKLPVTAAFVTLTPLCVSREQPPDIGICGQVRRRVSLHVSPPLVPSRHQLRDQFGLKFGLTFINSSSDGKVEISKYHFHSHFLSRRHSGEEIFAWYPSHREVDLH